MGEDFTTAVNASWVLERHGSNETTLATTLMVLDDAGVSSGVTATGLDFVHHKPARIEIPANPVVGTTWQQTGAIRTQTIPVDQGVTYTLRGEVRAGSEPDCLRLVVLETWSDGSDHSTDQERCRGRGLVADPGAGLQPMTERPPVREEISLN